MAINTQDDMASGKGQPMKQCCIRGLSFIISSGWITITKYIQAVPVPVTSHR